ncbi:tRNA lysidine(34) synthetase TilS [Cohnella lubricantis]|uniref:tRNA(Ile)-lysidine synthase n=1 Tax=Cohnella lubricantis TaxID=2163172 RepID=A0A841TFA1_9BACL|nr:tRNA lysidine(34) synthetase TilS [Cohnella lubricantis]MBB6679702.1 tRNA lysidine(34) synthetase TilS [Cohnella lubricantis]MBP2119376.1 tRNA(Ile)-lysidine synthase [Cohnella lubricantis]
MDELLRRMQGWTEGESWRDEGQTVVAGVSGGPDSMVLLHLLKTMAEEEGFRVVAAHVNHRFRGAEADAEEELVKRVAAEWGVGCETAAIDVPGYIAETGMNPQEAAREKRYAFLRQVARRHHAQTIALGHHADDQAETVLMRLLRGSGIGGLAGIPAKRTENDLELIRPLLRITKCELLEYADRHSIPYAFDSSNADRHYTRNAIRLDLLPALESYNPGVRTSLLRLSEIAAIEDDYMEAKVREALEETAVRSGEGWTLDAKRFRRLHAALQRRLIKLILNYAAPACAFWDYERVEEAASAIAAVKPAAARIDIGAGWVCVREYDQAYIGPQRPDASPFEYAVPGPDFEIIVREAEASFLFRRADDFDGSSLESPWEIYLDEEALRFPLAVRNRRPGDRLDPHGLNGSKKVQDMFVDAKVPRSIRDKVPLLTDAAGTVLWIPGMRRSRHALPMAGRMAVHVKVTRDSEA